MTPLLSVYLDLIRIGAALVVVLHHAWPMMAPAHPLPWPGSQAVIVFFVLSGYVIAFVADGREKTLRDFVMRRITRVWSVAIPALVLGAVLAPLVGASSPLAAAPPATSVWDIAFRSVMNLFFVGQVWTLDIEPPLNGPFWSLNYEVWYYALFAAWTYQQGWPRVLTVGALGLACGLKILLLLPCWLAGVWLYRHRPAISPRAAVAVFLGTIVAYLGVFQLDLPVRMRDHMMVLWPGFVGNLSGSNTFLGDYVVAALVAANFVGVANLQAQGRWLLAVRRPVAMLAAYAFSIYLYHVPLLAFLRGGLSLSSGWTVVMLGVTIALIGRVTERNLFRFRTVFDRLVTRIIGPPSQPATLVRADRR